MQWFWPENQALFRSVTHMNAEQVHPELIEKLFENRTLGIAHSLVSDSATFCHGTRSKMKVRFEQSTTDQMLSCNSATTIMSYPVIIRLTERQI